MILRALLGDGPAPLTPRRPLAPEQVILAGVRTGDDSEFEYLTATGLRCHGVADLEEAFDGLAGPVYAHIDLDVLDPPAFGSTCYPVPDGMSPDRLIDLVSDLDGLVGAAVTEHAPAADTDNAGEAEVLRRLSAALRR